MASTPRKPDTSAPSRAEGWWCEGGCKDLIALNVALLENAFICLYCHRPAFYRITDQPNVQEVLRKRFGDNLLKGDFPC